MICTKCGKENENENLFCRNCGNSLLKHVLSNQVFQMM